MCVLFLFSSGVDGVQHLPTGHRPRVHVCERERPRASRYPTNHHVYADSRLPDAAARSTYTAASLLGVRQRAVVLGAAGRGQQGPRRRSDPSPSPARTGDGAAMPSLTAVVRAIHGFTVNWSEFPSSFLSDPSDDSLAEAPCAADTRGIPSGTLLCHHTQSTFPLRYRSVDCSLRIQQHQKKYQRAEPPWQGPPLPPPVACGGMRFLQLRIAASSLCLCYLGNNSCSFTSILWWIGYIRVRQSELWSQSRSRCQRSAQHRPEGPYQELQCRAVTLVYNTGGKLAPRKEIGPGEPKIPQGHMKTAGEPRKWMNKGDDVHTSGAYMHVLSLFT